MYLTNKVKKSNYLEEENTKGINLALNIYRNFLLPKNRLTNKNLAEIGQEFLVKYHWNEVYEYLEIAQIKDAIQFARKNSSNEDILNYLINQEKLIPTKDIRSQTKVEKQQFSTPLTLSFCANYLAQINSKDIVLEPSAGNGGLAIFAALKGAEVVLNEIDNQRNHRLKYLFADEAIYSFNAEQVDDFLPVTIKPNKILINPPFSSNLYEKGKNNNTIARHTYSALKRLENKGKLVLISNEGFHPLNSTYSKWFEKINRIANLEFSVVVDGKIYQKNGTQINTRLSLFTKENSKTKTVYENKVNDVKTLFKSIQSFFDKKKNKIIEVNFQQNSLFEINENQFTSYVPFDNKENTQQLHKPTPTAASNGT